MAFEDDDEESAKQVSLLIYGKLVHKFVRLISLMDVTAR